MHLRKKLVVATALTASLALGGAAYAYWTTAAGTGTGTGNTAPASQPITVSGEMADALVPGSTGTLAVTLHNPNAYAVKVPGTVQAAAKVTQGALPVAVLRDHPDCGIVVSSDAVPASLAAGDNTVDLEVTWNDENYEQGDCLGKAIAFDITIAPPAPPAPPVPPAPAGA